MANNFVQVAPNSTGLKVDTTELVVGANTVERQNVCLADPSTAANVANVTASGALKVDASATTQPVSIAATLSDNLIQVGGVAITLGQKVMASSLPVTLASDQGGLPVYGSLNAQGFTSTSAPTYTSGSYGFLSLNTSGGVRVDPSGVTSPVSLASLPALATGANVIGAVTQSGTWNVGTITTLPALPTGANVIGALVANQSVNTAQIGASTIVTAAAGVQKVGIVGNGAATLDSAILSGAAPTNTLWITSAPSSVASAALLAKVFSAVAVATTIKASAGNLYGFTLISATATAGFVQFFNTATTATSGAVLIVPIAASGTITLTPSQIALLNFSTGIAINVATTVGGTTQITYTGTVFYL